jgi:hypothetical protein
MYDQIQTALTITIEVIALIGFIGLPIHAIVTHHINTVRSWGTPQSMPAVEPVVEDRASIHSRRCSRYPASIYERKFTYH